MKHTKMTLLALAVTTSFTTTVMADDNFNFYGHARAGISTTTDGGEQGCYGSGADGHYTGRLGDECATYIELGLSKSFATQDGKSIAVNSMLSVETDPGAQFNDYQSLTEPGSTTSRSDIALREMNMVADGYLDFAPEASLWAGKRFYKRQQVELLDLFYLNNSGYGAGIENIKTGFGELSVAWIAGDQPVYTGKPNAGDERMVQVNRLDLRLEHITIVQNANLDLALIYGAGDTNKVQENAGEPSDSGLFVTAQLNYQLAGGAHKLVAQYATDAMGDAAWSNASGSKVETYASWEGDLDNSMRLIAYGTQPLADKVDLDYSFIYASAETISDIDVSEESPSRVSFVLSPAYHWSDAFSTRLEIGHETYRESYQVEDQDLTKIIIAQEFSPTFAQGFAPKIRAYAGTFFGSLAEEQRTANAEGDDGNIRLGIQMFASW